MSEPTRDAASYLAQWDNNALPLPPHRTTEDHEYEGTTKAGKDRWLSDTEVPEPPRPEDLSYNLLHHLGAKS